MLMLRGLSLLLCATLGALIFSTGCAQQPTSYSAESRSLKKGRIEFIGLEGSLTFEQGRPLVIPIQVSRPQGEREYRLSVKVFGTRPVLGDDFYVTNDAEDIGRFYAGLGSEITIASEALGSQTLYLVLDEAYTEKIETNDRLRVQVDLCDSVFADGIETLEYKDMQNKLRLLEAELEEGYRAAAQLSQSAYSKEREVEELKQLPVIDGAANDRINALESEIAVAKRETAKSESELQPKRAEYGALLAQIESRRKELRAAPSSVTTTTAGRVFSLISVADYRGSLEGNLPLHDLTVFPLPEDETEYIFGRKIQHNFFVVRMTVRNSSDKDVLINVGMIQAAGQALVEPIGDEPRFTVPVQVAPQSREHVYTILDDEEPNQTRAVVFRSLEFAGALATALATGFDASTPTIKALGLYTGVGIPEGKKLWPDRWPGYKRNVVNYAMPNLLKVNSQASSQPYYLFFSKTELRAIVLDGSLYGSGKRKRLPSQERGFASPRVHVVQLSFDSLEVPFEEVQSRSNSAAATTGGGGRAESDAGSNPIGDESESDESD